MRRAVLLIFTLLFLSGLAFGQENGAPLPEGEQTEVSVFQGYAAEAVWTLISFIILILVLWIFAWPPLLKSLQARQEYIEKQIKDAESTREQAEEVLAEYNKRLSNADVEGKGIIAAHMKKAEAQRSEMLANTRDELEEMRARLKSEIEQDRRNANEAFWQQAGDIVVNLGSEILGRTIVKDDDRRLINEAIDKLKSEEESRE